MRLHVPPGITREQWRLLRDTMTGRERKGKGNVLAAFAGDEHIAAGRVALLRANVQAPARRMGFREWIATGIVAAILVVAGYFVVTEGESPLPRATAGSHATSAPVPDAATPVPSADVVVPRDVVAAAAPPPVIAPPVAARPVTPPSAVPAPVYSRALIELPSDTATVEADQPVARIWVRRRGRLSGEVSFLWWTETGSAQVDRDFRRITPRTAVIDSGASGVELLVPLVVDPSRQQPRTFYVKIDEPGSGSTLGERTLMQVSIVPPGYVEVPLGGDPVQP